MDPAPNQERPFRVCAACGSLTPRPSPRCVVCGEPSLQALHEEAERASERRFAQVIFGRGTPATWALIAANLVVFAAMAVAAGTANDGTVAYSQALLDFGAKANVLIDRGEYFRLVTPIFIHIGLFHLGVNMYSLYAVGPIVERLYGTARYLFMYLATGVAGVVGSYYIMPSAGLSAGASGALFGLIGVLLVFGVRYRNELPGVYRQAFSPLQLLPVLALNLYITFAWPSIDKGAHLGGLFAGMALAAVVPYAGTRVTRERVVWRVAAAACALVIVGSFVAAYRAPRHTLEELGLGAPPGGGAPGLPGGAVNADLVGPYNESNRELVDALQAVEGMAGGEAPPADAAARARAAAAAALRARGVDERSRALLDRQGRLLERAAELLSGGRSAPTKAEVSALVEEFLALQRDWNTWFESEGEKYGLTIQRNDTQSGGRDGD